MMDKSFRAQLRELVQSGMSPEDAARQVLAPYNKPDLQLAELAWPLVLRQAKDYVLDAEHSVRMAAFSGQAGVDLSEKSRADRLRLMREAQISVRRQVFRIPGTDVQVLWDDIDASMIHAKLAWLRATRRGIEEHEAWLEKALLLMAEYRVHRLGDVPNWAQLIAGETIEEPVSVNPTRAILPRKPVRRQVAEAISKKTRTKA